MVIKNRISSVTHYIIKNVNINGQIQSEHVFTLSKKKIPQKGAKIDLIY